MTPEIEEFSKLLVRFVRDASVKSNDMALRPTVTAPVARRWRSAAQNDTTTEFARVLIPDIVDDTIFYLLRAIDEGILPLTFRSSNGVSVDLNTAGKGELAGWYMGSGGWRAMYSEQRFVDDFADLRNSDP